MTLESITKLCLLVFLWLLNTDCAAADHSIRIEMASTVYTIFEPLTVSVTFQNDGKTEWSVFKPDQSPFTHLHCVPLNNPHNPRVGYWFGKLDYVKTVIPGKATIEAVGVPKHIPLKIPPGGNYQFQTTMNDPDPENCLVGTWRVVVKNSYEKEMIESNAVEFQTVLTRRGIERLVREVRDSKLPPQDRRWRAGWLVDLQRDLKLQLRYDDVSEQERARMEAATQAELDRFETLWKRDRDTPQMAARLEAINVRKGATAEAMRAMEERESQLAPEPPPEPKASKTPEKPPESKSTASIPTPPDLTTPRSPSPAPSPSPVPPSTQSSTGISWPAAIGLFVLLAVVAVRRSRGTPTL